MQRISTTEGRKDGGGEKRTTMRENWTQEGPKSFFLPTGMERKRKTNKNVP